ncbi:hypothetical protein K5M76_09430 [Shewanella xiamenensis]|uniref:hypothetical protein n=1 Tax=Shewanella xiamenensis TaxID=332186 RepID=UPI00217E1674|nr:hypothetical protein [Shewanella xiamenensis]MCT8857570.1 hypothetical protein [Shewanella xiamenensis]UWG66411.1 hypothetical protein K5M76_09430 [Shewanella xiamenensis]
MEQIEFYQEFGYMRDREQRLREISSGKEGSLSLEAANQIKHLKDVLKELVSIVEIHSKATGKNFAWAELEEAKKALHQK